jgi:hypothetical protein
VTTFVSIGADNVQERDKTVHETIVKALKRPFETFDDLLDRCLPTLTARLWATCCWPAQMNGGWKIGDYNFLMVSVTPEPGATIYVQFWSEPQEPVLAEVSSGEWSPGTLKYVGPKQKELLKGFNFEIGGRAGNFHKEVTIASSAEAEAMAREVLRILYDVFGYRGQWPIELRRHEGERAEVLPTYASLTPEDFAKLANAAGMHAAVVPLEGSGGDSRSIRLLRHHRKSVAVLGGRIPGHSLYTRATFRALLPVSTTDGAVRQLNGVLRMVRARRGDHAIHLEMSISLAGGVTAAWLTAAFADWFSGCRRAESILKARPPCRQNRSSSDESARVH